MNPFKVIRKSTTEKGTLAKTYAYVYEDRIVIYQLFLLKKRDKNFQFLCKKFGMNLMVNSMAFKMDTFVDVSNNIFQELCAQRIITRKL